MKKHSFILLALLFCCLLSSAFGVDIIIGTGTTENSYPFDIYYGYSRFVSLFNQTEIGYYGTITHLSWHVTDYDSGVCPLKIYLKTQTSNVLTPDTYLNMISGATLVYQASRYFNYNAWHTIDITDFNYTSGNLLVLTETNYGGSGTWSYPEFAYTWVSDPYMSCMSQQDYSPYTGVLWGTGIRPNIMITLTAPEQPPISAINPFPAHLANDVAISTNLSWSAGSGFAPTGYKIYLGTDNPPTNMVNGTDLGLVTTFDPPDFSYSQTYYWKVVPYNLSGDCTNPSLWSFTTMDDPTVYELPKIYTFTQTGDFSGWIPTSSNGYAYWSTNSYNYAGGTIPELKHEYGYNQTSNVWTRLLSPPIQVVGLSSTEVKWRQFFDWDNVYNGLGLTLKFQYSFNGTDFTDLWSQAVSADIPAQEMVYNVSFADREMLWFSWYVYGNPYDMMGWFLDDIRILLPVSQIGEGTGTVNIPSITIPGGTLNTSVTLSGLPSSPLFQSSVIYQPVIEGFSNVELMFRLEGTDFGGAHVLINHNLGYIPLQLAYRIVPGAWIQLNQQSSWTSSLADFDVPVRSSGDLEVLLPSQDAPLPVELSSFSATAGANLTAVINWVAQSETALAGYLIYRNVSADASSAQCLLTTILPAHNSSQPSSYSYTDTDIIEPGTYYYWLQSLNMCGTSDFYGPVMVILEDGPGTPLPQVSVIYNGPNPFTSSTSFYGSVKEGETALISIFNLRGQLIHKVIVLNGDYTDNPMFSWDGRDMEGNDCSAGIYFYRLSSPSSTICKKMIMYE